MDTLGSLRPLEEARDSVAALTTYRTEAELSDALIRTRDAVEQALRLFLRSAPEAPDSARMAAFSPAQLPTDELIATLRRHDLISLELAGQVHDLDAASRRAASGEVHATDADTARNAVRNVMREVGARESNVATAAAANQVAEAAPEIRAPGLSSPHAGHRRSPGLVAALAGVVVLIIAVVLIFRLRGNDISDGITAFRAGRMAEAESIFRKAADSGSEDAGVWLYLGRIYRREGRPEEAAEALRTAVRLDENDADIRRELGYLFLDLGRPDPAIEQFKRAQELEPDDPSAWMGLIRALRTAGSPETDEWLARAPRSVRERLTGQQVTTTNE